MRIKDLLSLLRDLSKEELIFSLWPPKLSAKGLVAILLGVALAWRIGVGDFGTIYETISKGLSYASIGKSE